MFLNVKILRFLYVVIVISSYLLWYTEATDVQQVRLIKLETGSASDKPFDVLRNKSLNIIFENFFATSVNCFGAINKEDVNISSEWSPNEFENYENGSSLFHIPMVTNSMNTKWNCSMKTLKDGVKSSINHLFAIRVRGARRVSVEVNGFQPTFRDTDLSVSEYDGVHEFEYEDGDFVDLTCITYEKGEIGLRYYDANDNIVFERPNGVSSMQLRFQKSLRAQDDNSYVDCTYVTTGEYFVEFTNRTVFKLKETSSRYAEFVVIINGTKLIPHKSNDNKTGLYQYMYINGTMLDVTCKMSNQRPKSNISLDDTGIKIQDLPTKGPYERRFMVDTRYINGMKLECLSPGIRSASIQFFADPYLYVAILGLPESGILYQYSKSWSDNYVEWMTYYEYDEKETFNITCMTTEKRTPYWTPENESVIDDKIYSRNGFKYVTILWNAGHNSNEITCNSKMAATRTQKITVIFHQKINSLSKEVLELSEDPSPQKALIFVGYAIVVLVIIVTVLWAYRRWTRKRKAGHSECPYESINEDVSIPPFPKQWDENEYAYITNEAVRRNGNISNQNEENIMVDNPIYFKSNDPQYVVPYDSVPGSSNRIENPYAEIDDDFIKNCLEGNGKNSAPGGNSNDNYISLLKGKGDKSYISFRESNVLYSDIFKARQGGVNSSNSSKD